VRKIRILAIGVLAFVSLGCALAGRIAPASYADQFRAIPDAGCSRNHPLGTDDLGRDRLARLLYGTRISLLLAPAAALLATLLAAFIGGAAGFFGGRAAGFLMAATDLVMAMPWFFLLVTVRALLPLNVPPVASVTVTFALLGCLGWAGAARVVCADACALCRSDVALMARASGSSGMRLLWLHILPNLKPVLYAQFWVSIPVFILTEANLGLLGLGVAEPLPSWGGLLRELETFSIGTPQPWLLAPLVLLVLTVGCFQLAAESKETRA
jgi:peptide/nickel transport system permease protein